MAIKESVTIDETVAFLNELFAIDPTMLKAMIINRVPCNQKMADHPTVQVWDFDGDTRVGLLGFLNGLFGVSDKATGAIGVVLKNKDDSFIDNQDIVEFTRLAPKKE